MMVPGSATTTTAVPAKIRSLFSGYDTGTQALLALAALAFMARAFVIVMSVGSNDMTTWLGFAEKISETSVGQLYDEHKMFNHPPLMGLFASAAYDLSRVIGVRFEWLFKAPLLLADVACAWLLFLNWQSRGIRRAAAVVALFAWNPASILIGAYHGNTDALCVSFMLLSAILMDRALAFWSGLALAAAINVKLIPVLLIVPLWVCVRDRQGALRFLAGLSIGALPFLPYMIGHWHGFYQHVLSYRSNPRLWGIPFILAQLQDVEHVGTAALALAKFWAKKGTLALLCWPVLLAWWRRKRQPDFGARELGACTLLGFMVLTPGWGVQYLVYPVPLLFAVNVELALWYSTLAGLNAFALYASLWTGGVPWYSDFFRGEPFGPLAFGCLVWAVAARLAFALLRRRQPAPALVGVATT
ncbi:MAG TPA: glycosyltransferase 87 family protein [Polyangiaceae bacterium]|jgi:hypothetical protein|nr:glycosyltransferase 87 family protein [Polyangiaceae bacterium]